MKMERAAWPQVRSDLVSVRQGAATFLGNLSADVISGAIGRQNWAATWTEIGDARCLLAELNIKKKAFEEATEAWLCALTAFEVAKHLVDEDDPKSGDISAKVEATIQKLGLSLQQKLERVRIACCDQAELLAHYLPAGNPELSAPAIICIAREQEAGATLLGRLLPALIGRGMAVLIVSYDDVSNSSGIPSETLLSCCLDYLSVRPEINAGRIGVYGEGSSAALATDFAASDSRVAAAVCDGGIWNWARTMASVRWMTRTADMVDDDEMSARRSRLVRRVTCPVLVVAGGRAIISVSEAIKLQSDCLEAHIDMELAIPPMIRTIAGEIEDFVSFDDRVLGWLEHKLKMSGRRGQTESAFGPVSMPKPTLGLANAHEQPS
ncbi:hypothetical protein [Bradyrhizobium sp. BWA-3-5]|uniref:alpha/beta hydrolase family protein n=1 Tax=Bradyrhizobium sp. BWA-3-5 TaxID=3080013 RepID=UPI00293E242E|nr:hypothetical protein [Bradyrhizobium sp. BWA-3-5]WOH64339.1 hypothetical protein RX331_27855 [Bradyrhizobium sp. BWA-3-5]